jgi:cobaltochelatase CobT
MSSLADLPEVIGFFSYSREDDESFTGRLSALREAIQHELGAQLGRSKTTFRLWQDKEAIAPGKLWELEISSAVDQSVFFIPIITPRLVNSNYCKFEFDAFLARERALGRTDLVFPILYVPVPALESEARWRDHPVLSAIAKRQYVD